MSSLSPRSKSTPVATLEGPPPGRSSFGQAAYASRQSGTPEPPRFQPQIDRSLRLHPALATWVAAAVCCFFVFLGVRAGRLYKAESLVYIDPIIPGGTTPQGMPGYDQFRYSSYLDQQMQTVTRPDTLTAALRKLPPGTWRGAEESEQSAIARLQKALVVERVATAYEFSIKLVTPNAEKSAAVVNAVTSAYLQGGRKDELTQAGGRAQILDEERQRIAEQLKQDEAEQAALGTNLGVANPTSEAGNPFDVQLTNLRTQLAVAREAHDVAAAQLSSVSGEDASHRSGLAAAADESINADLGLGSLKSSINARRALIESDMAGLTPTNPRYKQDQDELADLDRSIESMTVKLRAQAERRIQDKLRTDLQRTAAVEAQLNGQLANETAKATGAGPKLQRASELAVDIHRLNDRYTAVDESLRTLQLETNGPGMAHLAVAAAVPDAPERNYRNIFLLAAVPFGLLFGTVAAVGARAWDKRIFVGADLEQTVGFPPLAVLPSREDVPERVIDEYVLRLAAGVEGAYRTAAARTFVVTAVSARTGTLDLLHALAKKLEELRLKILVMRASDLLAISNETAEYRLTALQNGKGQSLQPLHESDGIGSAKLERLKGDHDIILIDGEPLLHSATTEYVARCADATLLVAQSGVTLRTELANAASLLARLHVAGVGAVLGDLRLKFADPAFISAVGIVELRDAHRGAERLKAVPESPERIQPSQPAEPTSARVDEDAVTSYVEDEHDLVTEDVLYTPVPRPVDETSIDEAHEHSEASPVETVDERQFVRREVEYEKSGSEYSRSVLIRPRRALRNFERDTSIAVEEPVALDEISSASAYAEGQLDHDQPGSGRTITETQTPDAMSQETYIAVPEPIGESAQGGLSQNYAPPLPPEDYAVHASGEDEKIASTAKEPEVNSMSTWFNKLFGRERTSSFSVVPSQEEGGYMDPTSGPTQLPTGSIDPQDAEFHHFTSASQSDSRSMEQDSEEPAASAEFAAYPEHIEDPYPNGYLGTHNSDESLRAEYTRRGQSFEELVNDAFAKSPESDDFHHLEPRAELHRFVDDLSPPTEELSSSELDVWPTKTSPEMPTRVDHVEDDFFATANPPELHQEAPQPLETQPTWATMKEFREELQSSELPEQTFGTAESEELFDEPQQSWIEDSSDSFEPPLPAATDSQRDAEAIEEPALSERNAAPAAPVEVRGEPGVARGLSRRWALLSQYDPTATDPLPSTRRSNNRFMESRPHGRDEGNA